NDVAAPARLQIASFKLTNGTVITRSMTSFGVQFHVGDTCGQPVSGALVYVTGVPYNQLSIPAEGPTDAAGNVTPTFNRKAGFPASSKQRLLVLFVRARKSGDPLLAGISTRRLVSLRVNLNQNLGRSRGRASRRGPPARLLAADLDGEGHLDRPAGPVRPALGAGDRPLRSSRAAERADDADLELRRGVAAAPVRRCRGDRERPLRRDRDGLRQLGERCRVGIDAHREGAV